MQGLLLIKCLRSPAFVDAINSNTGVNDDKKNQSTIDIEKSTYIFKTNE